MNVYSGKGEVFFNHRCVFLFETYINDNIKKKMEIGFLDLNEIIFVSFSHLEKSSSFEKY